MTISFRNNSASGQVVYFGKGLSEGIAIANAEYVLSVGESLNFILLFDGEDIKDDWWAIADAASALVYVGETSEREVS